MDGKIKNGESMFLSFEGVDGSGKSTQIQKLCTWFDEMGTEYITCREPGTTPLGTKVRSLLLNHHRTPIDIRAEALLFMTSRAQLVQEVIEPAIEQSKVVVCDRFLLSTIVYQGYAGGLDVDELWRVGRFATAGVLPDLTLVFDLPVQESFKRIGDQRDRMESRGIEYFQAVRDGFLTAAARDPDKIKIVDARQDVETIFDQVKTLTQTLMTKRKVDPQP